MSTYIKLAKARHTNSFRFKNCSHIVKEMDTEKRKELEAEHTWTLHLTEQTQRFSILATLQAPYLFTESISLHS